MLSAFAVLLVTTAVLAWANERYLRIPTTVGVTLAGALAAIVFIALDYAGAPGVRGQMTAVFERLDFTQFVLHGILSLLLFAGAMSLDAARLVKQVRSVLTLSIVSTAISTVLIGVASYGVFALVGLDVPFWAAMLFGALLSPTDPVAVLDLLQRAKVPKKIETLIAGESLFNDGVGVVFYLVVAGFLGIAGSSAPGPLNALEVFAQEAIGGMLLGAVLGWVCFLACRSVEARDIEVLITLATVIGGYVLADRIGVSGPLAMVVAGLIMSAGKTLAFHAPTRHDVEVFWEILDRVLNIILFAFIGLDVLLTETTWPQIVASALLIVVALVARFISVGLPMMSLRSIDGYGPYTVRLLTWGGLRGGIAISLALGLPESSYRLDLVTATYVVVLFTIAVQGLTVMPLVRRAADAERRREAAAHGEHGDPTLV
ncbi:cation:proton antiporter [Kribbia dieselivorans]|uniref:cation:proton antiporter n=1 Tax=Kribbia dieselivorans TaxID=331526 RepID=UPI000837BDCF|nr:sodium:proton antiporter [Kribbia dieselivorans]